MEAWKWLTKHRRITILEMFFKDFILVLSSPSKKSSFETLHLNLAIKDGQVVDLPQIWSWLQQQWRFNWQGLGFMELTLQHGWISKKKSMHREFLFVCHRWWPQGFSKRWFDTKTWAGWWFGVWLLWLSIQLGMSSSQLTNSYFSEG